jgi:hypothetical protein
VIVVIAADHPLPAEAYRQRLNGLAGLSHVTVEVRGAGTHHDHGHG